MSPKKIPTSLAVCRWDKTDTLDSSVHEAKVKSSMYKSYVTMHRYASGKSSSIHPLFSCVQRAKIFCHAHAETSAPPRHYFFCFTGRTERIRDSSLRRTVTRQQTTTVAPIRLALDAQSTAEIRATWRARFRSYHIISLFRATLRTFRSNLCRDGQSYPWWHR